MKDEWTKPDGYVNEHNVLRAKFVTPKDGSGLEKETIRFSVPRTPENIRKLFGR